MTDFSKQETTLEEAVLECDKKINEFQTRIDAGEYIVENAKKKVANYKKQRDEIRRLKDQLIRNEVEKNVQDKLKYFS